MKKLIVLLVILGATSIHGIAQKFGHVDSQALLLSMPGRENAEKTLQASAAELEAVLATMQTEYEQKVTEIQNNPDWPETIRQTKVNQVLALEQDIQQFQVNANQELSQKEAELLQPMIDSAKKAIEDVASENGFTYIFDASTGVLLYTGGEDILALVKAKLGIE